jgi:membrane protein insertase Oxa1/YidC/SpoIIIJ
MPTASALSLYWFVSGLVAYIQQGRVLNKDEEEMKLLLTSLQNPVKY